MKKRAVVQVAVAVVLIGLAAWLFARHFTAEPSSEHVPVRCVGCGHEYVPKRASDDPECPKCHAGGGLQLVYFHCNKCGATFLAYEQDPRQGLIREPGGEWTTTQAFVPRPVVCPKCSSSNTVFVKDPGQVGASQARGE